MPLGVRIQRKFGQDLKEFALGRPNPKWIQTELEGIAFESPNPRGIQTEHQGICTWEAESKVDLDRT
jgi:hypothetical protein